MNKDYVNKIVCNENNVFYVVKAYDGYTLRIEQLKKWPDKGDCENAISLQQIRNNHKTLNIIYYGYGMYDKMFEEVN